MISGAAIEILANIAASRGIASSANEFNTLAAPLLLIVGIGLAFFGRKFVKTLVFLAGALQALLQGLPYLP
ncbi:MAG: hypothetical protein FJ358_06975 [Thaumarchaeota archaeon]|nr:hypothetical protein [Nitrososphaerota archaeon]